jgi:antitoxin component YwqK of YwqJK toxin-antitoxin module
MELKPSKSLSDPLMTRSQLW